MLKYWISEIENNITYSIDMLRFDFVVSDRGMIDVLRYLTNPKRTDIVDRGMTIASFKYRYLFNINYHDSSMAVGLSLNGTTAGDNLKCFCEFNPNKVMPEVLEDLYFLIDNCLRFKLRRWDLAIDIPRPRNLVQLVKDQRKYSLTMKSSDDKTEYLGSRNTGGFIKLYNKTIESKLDTDVTRLEVTCSREMRLDDIMAAIPKLLFSQYQLELSLDDKLSDKDRLLVDLLKMHPDMFPRLDRRNRKKFEPYIFGEKTGAEFSRFCVRKLMERIHLFEK